MDICTLLRGYGLFKVAAPTFTAQALLFLLYPLDPLYLRWADHGPDQRSFSREPQALDFLYLALFWGEDRAEEEVIHAAEADPQDLEDAPWVKGTL
ncbi:MAG: hypothetical protein ACO3EZ_16495 [Prochlorotrichaceae cyanobacterium]